MTHIKGILIRAGEITLGSVQCPNHQSAINNIHVFLDMLLKPPAGSFSCDICMIGYLLKYTANVGCDLSVSRVCSYGVLILDDSFLAVRFVV